MGFYEAQCITMLICTVGRDSFAIKCMISLEIKQKLNWIWKIMIVRRWSEEAIVECRYQMQCNAVSVVERCFSSVGENYNCCHFAGGQSRESHVYLQVGRQICSICGLKDQFVGFDGM